MVTNLNLITSMFRTCDALLIAAGAGMGVDSGLPDFRGKEGFWKAYPPLAKLKISFEEMANPRWFKENPKLAWGFYGHRYNLYQNTNPHAGYFMLREWINKFQLPSFVFTSNVDGHFTQTGWTDSMFECHGSLMHLQCMNSCGQPVWPMAVSSVRDFKICPDTIICKSKLPTCPNCEELARPNILMFSDFYWDPSLSLIQEKRLHQWLDQHGDKKLLILEIGAGLSVPTVRSFCEGTRQEYDCDMIRVNPRDSMSNSVIHSMPIGALDAINLINDRLFPFEERK